MRFIANYFVISCIFLNYAIYPAQAYGGQRSVCPVFLQKISEVRKKYVMPYIQEVLDTYGLRLFFKKNTKQTEKTYILGFFRDSDRENNFLDRSFQFPFNLVSKSLLKKKIDFTPLQAIDDLVVGKPTKYISQKITGKPYGLTILAALVTGGILFGFVFDQIDEQYGKALLSHTVNMRKPHLDSLIQYDFRFHSLYTSEYRGALENKKAFGSDVYMKAEVEEEIYENYYSFMNANPDSDNPLTLTSADSVLLEHPLFAHIKSVFDKGLDDIEGYLVTQKGPISGKQKKEIIEIQNRLQYEYEIISSYVQNKPSPISRFDPDQIRSNKSIQGYISKLENDPFTLELKRLETNGKLKLAEVSYYLQEDAFWSAQFEIYDVLKMKKLMKKSQSEYDNTTFVSNNTIREETLRGLH